MSGSSDKVIVSAIYADEMAEELKKIAEQMRANPDDLAGAYASIYNWRTEFSKKVLHRLGFGMPRRRLGKP